MRRALLTSHRRPRLALFCAALIGVGTIAAVQPAAADETGLDRYGSIDQPSLQQNWDDNEPGLTSDAVQDPDFGKRWSTTVDGTSASTPNQVYAQPLVYKGRVYVGTEENEVEVLDEQTGMRITSRHLGTPWTPNNCGDLVPHIGITGTPVIDSSTNTIYLITDLAVPNSKNSKLEVWGLDMTTLATKPGWPLEIKGVASNTTFALNPNQQGQRPSLVMDGKHALYFGMASHCSQGPYVGYVGRVSTGTAGAAGALHLWSTQRNSAYDQGGVWMGGGAPMIDGTDANGNPRLFVATGNGLGPSKGAGGAAGAAKQSSFGQSVIRLGVNNSTGTLSPQDFFSPANSEALNGNDEDIGSTAPVALPDSFGTSGHRHLVTVAGKAGVAYLLDRDNLGGMGQGVDGVGPDGKDAALSEADLKSGVWGRAATFDGGTSTTRYVYYAPSHRPIQAFRISPNGAGVPSFSAPFQSRGSYNYGTSPPLITSDPDNPASAMLWLATSDGNAGTNGVLVGYPALPPTSGQWKPLITLPIGNQNKFANIASSDNRLFVGTKDGKVLAFGSPSGGALTTSDTTFDPQPADGTTTTTKTVTLTAAEGLTVNSLSAAAVTKGATFGVGTTSSQHLDKSATLQVPVTFETSTAGANTGTLTADVTPDDTGTTTDIDFTLHGTGTRDGIIANPTSLAFGQQPTVTPAQQSMTIQNTSASAETITHVTPPAKGSFSFAGTPPAVGQQIPSLGSVTFTVNFAPSQSVRYVGSFGVGATVQGKSTEYTATIGLSGQGVHGTPKLQVGGSLYKNGHLDFGTVAPGARSSGTLTITNVGNVPDHLNKAAPPAGVFSVPQPIDEGITLAPGESASAAITVSPTTGGLRTDQYQFTDSVGRTNVPIRVNAYHQAGEIRGKFGCVTDKGLARGNGVPIVNSPCNGTRSQILGLDSAGHMHWFATYGDFCMDVTKAGTTPGTPIQFLNCNGSVAQQWEFSASGKLVNPHAKLCLAVRNSQTADNTPLILASCASTSLGELWDPTGLITKRGAFTSALGGGGKYCVTGPAYGAARGTPTDIQQCSLQYYSGIDDSYLTTPVFDKRKSQVIAHVGTTLRVAGGCLTQAAAGSGQRIVIAPCLNARTQQWTTQSNGSIVNPASKLCLNVYGGTPTSTSPYRNLVSYTCNGSAAQIFTLPDV